MPNASEIRIDTAFKLDVKIKQKFSLSVFGQQTD
jgi:hypothetical protein